MEELARKAKGLIDLVLVGGVAVLDGRGGEGLTESIVGVRGGDGAAAFVNLHHVAAAVVSVEVVPRIVCGVADRAR